MSNRHFYITTPIYYPNGEPHLGSVYTTTICDVLARYHRLQGQDTYFLTGTDEHGTKMVKAAAEAGVQPIELATRYADIFRSVWVELKISTDDFIRTTEDRHKSAVQRIVQELVAKGDIYLGSYQGWYDEGQEQFVTETEAKNNEFKSAISGKPLTRYTESTYFFRLQKYVPAILAHIEAHPDFIVPVSRRNEVISKLKVGVEDLSVSRATLKWGIPMPHDPQHVVYVWIDALTNYITALGYGSDDRSKFDKYWPVDVHVIGKDILWFHAVYWPAMLLSLGLPLPKTIAAHGWWVRGGKKAGKSTGGITTLPEIRELVTKYSLDALRYHLLRAAPFGSDLEWSQEEFDKSYNELANVVGNCLNRTLKMINRYRGGVLPGIGEHDAIDDAVSAKSFAISITSAYEKLELQQCAMLPIEFARAANGYIDATAPFSLAKDPGKAARLDTVLHLSAQAIYRALVALLPILPEKAAAGLAQLGVDLTNKTLNDLLASDLPAGQKLNEGVPLFPKVESVKSTPPNAQG
ncbi:MAG TPA: methionine--tRNA ligase [Tepidisphaeraceae bacterium]|nr:methionine--tRNA ligase [Tepidisphaeraceae bacterium]